MAQSHKPGIWLRKPYPSGVGERERNRCRERVEALAFARLGADEARFEAIGALRRAVAFERWCWPLTDPSSALSVSGIGEVDFWPSLARLVALEHGGDVTSKPRLLACPRPSVSLSAATRGELARSKRWRECLSPYGIGDELMTACRDRQGFWGSLELMRDTPDPPFDEHDQRLLDQLAPILGALVRSSMPHGWQADTAGAQPRPPGTLIVDGGLLAASWTPSFRDWLSELPPAGPDPEMLPPAVYEIASRALAPSGHQARLPNQVRIRTLAARWVVIEGAPLQGAGSGQVAITVRPAAPDEVLDILCRTYDLTPRERQLFALMLGGLATKQLAQALYISPYTVQDHLKAIFQKTGVRSRRELISQLAGHHHVAATPPDRHDEHPRESHS